MVAVGIREPPAAPVMKYTELLDRCSTMTGVIDDSGRFLDATWLLMAGVKLNAFLWFGIEKSFSSSLRMIPVNGSITVEPNSKFIVLVTEMLNPVSSVPDIWAVPSEEGSLSPSGL